MENTYSRSTNASNESENRAKMTKIGVKQDQRLRKTHLKHFKTATEHRTPESENHLKPRRPLASGLPRNSESGESRAATSLTRP